MSQRPKHLHAIVAEFDGLIEAQLLELDIAVQAKSEEALLDELAHAITMEYRIAKHHGKTPFVHLAQAPSEFVRMGESTKDSDWHCMGELKLDDAVIEALAVALKVPEPHVMIESFVKKAA